MASSSSSSTLLPLNSSALLLLDLPTPTLAGIDLLSFTTSPRFRGVRGIPLEGSPHFAFVAAATEGVAGGRCGVWFSHSSSSSSTEYSQAGGVPLTVLKWVKADESLGPETREVEALRWKGNLGGVWREALTPYRQNSGAGRHGETEGDDWVALTRHVSPVVLMRVLKDSYAEVGEPAAAQRTWRVTTMSASISEMRDIPGFHSSADSTGIMPASNGQSSSTTPNPEVDTHDPTLHFLPINLRQTWATGVTGRARTTAARDRSWALSDLLETHCSNNPDHILGELQFAFVMLLTLSNVSCAEQWQRLLRLLLTCVSAVQTHSSFFVDLLQTLHRQLRFCLDADAEVLAFLDVADEQSELKTLLVRFRRGIETLPAESKAVRAVLDELEELETFLQESRGWRFGGAFAKQGMLMLEDGEEVRVETTAFDEEDEEGEFAPTIVDLTEEQAGFLGVERGAERAARRGGRGKSRLEQLRDEGSDDDNDDEDDVQRERNPTVDGNSDESDDEEMGDLDDMDARF